MNKLGNIFLVTYNKDLGFLFDKMTIVYENKTYYYCKKHGSDWLFPVHKNPNLINYSDFDDYIKFLDTRYFQKFYVYVPNGATFKGSADGHSTEAFYSDIRQSIYNIKRLTTLIERTKNAINDLEYSLVEKEERLKITQKRLEELKSKYLEVNGKTWVDDDIEN